MGGILIAAGAFCAGLALGVPAAWSRGPAPSEVLAQGLWLWRLAGLVLAVALAATGVLLRRAGPGDPAPRLAPLSAPLRGGLLGVLALALGLRLVHLGDGLWYDEIVTLVEFVRLPTGSLLTTYTSQNNHILFSLLAQGSVALFGEGAWALRLPAALLGVGCVAAVFHLGRRLLDAPQGLWAALLVAVSYHHVWFSQNARGYTGLMLCTVVATDLFAEGMRRRARRLWVGYAVVFALAMALHLSAVFVFAAHGAIWVAWLLAGRLGTDGVRVRHPGACEAWPALGFVLGGLLTLQLYALLLPQMFQTFGVGADTVAPTRVDEWQNPLWTALEVARGLGLGPGSAVLGLAGAAVGALGFWRLLRCDAPAALAMVVPGPLVLAVLVAISYHIWPRYFFPLMGFAALIGVHGVAVLASALARRWRPAAPQRLAAGLTAAAVLALALASALGLRANYRAPKQSYAAARDWVEAQRGADDAVVTAGLASFAYQRYYAPGWNAVESAAQLDAARSRAPRTWLVYSFPTHMRMAHPDLLEAAADFQRVRVFPATLGDGEIYVLRSDRPMKAP